MPVPILKQGSILIATVQSSLNDADVRQLGDELVARAGRLRIHSIVVDVSSLDVMDSFAVRMLRNIAHRVRLRGADILVVGIQPDVAFAMVQLGLTLEDVPTALDLDDGLAWLQRHAKEAPARGR